MTNQRRLLSNLSELCHKVFYSRKVKDVFDLEYISSIGRQVLDAIRNNDISIPTDAIAGHIVKIMNIADHNGINV